MKRIPAHIALAVAIVSLWWLPNMFAKGMFMDGVYNALMAHNLVTGLTTLWTPETIYYTKPAYWDNPQLATWFLSGWYKVLGDYYFVERLYSFSCGLVQLILIGLMWKTVYSNQSAKRTYYTTPIIVFLISPLTIWCYTNNMLENTMALFTTASIIVYLHYWQTQKHRVLYALVGGGGIFLACITKGPVGLFPLTAPILFAVIIEPDKLKQSVVYATIQLIALAIAFMVFLSFTEPAVFVSKYLQLQLLPVLQHKSVESDPHYRIGLDLVEAALPWLIVGTLCFVWGIKNKYKSSDRLTIAFFAIALSASAPIAFSAKQHKYYLLPSLVFYSMAFAIWLQPFIQIGIQKVSKHKVNKLGKGITAFSLLILIVSIVWCVINSGNYARDRDILTDLETIQPTIKNEEVIRADWTLFNAWSLRGYLNRLYGKKLCMPDENACTHYYMTLQNKGGDKLPSSAVRIYAGQTIDLYKLP